MAGVRDMSDEEKAALLRELMRIRNEQWRAEHPDWAAAYDRRYDEAVRAYRSRAVQEIK